MLRIVFCLLLAAAWTGGNAHGSVIGKDLLDASKAVNDFAPDESTPEHQAMEEEFRRRMTPWCDSGEILFCDYQRFDSCGGLSTENEDRWCEDPLYGRSCCGDDVNCCDPKWGLISFLIVLLLAAFVASIIGCCLCCSCCPMARHRLEMKKAGQAAQAPVVVGQSQQAAEVPEAAITMVPVGKA